MLLGIDVGGTFTDAVVLTAPIDISRNLWRQPCSSRWRLCLPVPLLPYWV